MTFDQYKVWDKTIKRAALRGLLALLLLGALLALAWGHYAYQGKSETQQVLMTHSVDAAAAEIGTLIRELRRGVNILAHDHRAMVARLIRNPADDEAYLALSGLLRSHYPELYAFTLADTDGEPLLERDGEYVGRGCRVDIRSFAADSEVEHIALHPSPGGPHFDVMGQWRTDAETRGVFFISLKPDMLVRLLARHERPGHRLLLLDRDSDSVAISATGAGVEQLGEMLLDDASGAELVARKSVVGTRWQLAALPDADVLAKTLRDIWISASLLFASLFVVGLAVIVTLLRQSVRRSAVERALSAQRNRARTTIDALADAVIATDANECIAYLNPSAEKLLGCALDEARGRPLTEVFRPADERDQQPYAAPLQVTSLCQAVLLGAQGAAPVLVEYRASEIPDGAGHVITCRDITENRALARQLVHQANHDGLTGLFNRYAFSRSLRNVLDEVAEQGAKRALLYIDLDQFKLVNDTAGHVAGDALLRQVAERFGSVLAENDLLARLGGDEFAAILFDCDAERAMAVANALIASVREYSFQWERRQFRVGASIGVVPLAADCVDPVAVLTQADVACYTAKDSGRNRAHLYRVDDGQLSWHHSELHRAAELETMLVSGGFSLNAQPIVRLSDGSISHYELLLRVHGAEGGATSPGAFISAAERFGMMSAIDRWVFNQAVRVCTSQAKSKMTPLCINISGSTISDPESANYIVVRLRDARLPAGRICFEITETAVVSDPEAAARFIAEVKTLGCTIALDDFGSGLASFASLKSLPVDLLKIDGSLVRRVSTDAADRAMVAAIHEMARALSLLTVAEWVEDGRTATMLRDMGIEYGQGFALGRGQPLHEMFKDQKLYAP